MDRTLTVVHICKFSDYDEEWEKAMVDELEEIERNWHDSAKAVEEELPNAESLETELQATPANIKKQEQLPCTSEEDLYVSRFHQ